MMSVESTILREVPEDLKTLKDKYISGHSCGRKKEWAKNQALVRAYFVLQSFDLKEEIEEVAREVLEEYAADGHNQMNLSSLAARTHIAEAIERKIEELIQPDIEALQNKQRVE